MDQNEHDRFEQYMREGFTPHEDPRRYLCGWCGSNVSSFIGLYKRVEFMQLGFGTPYHDSKETDVRICTECWNATTFRGPAQLPRPIEGEFLDPSSKADEAKRIVGLYDEARIALTWRAPSCAVLMFRKILMHIAVEQGAATGKGFIEYVDYLKNQKIVGTPQYSLLDRIRTDGNAENHEIRTATNEQARDLLNLVTLLIRSIYFSS